MPPFRPPWLWVWPDRLWEYTTGEGLHCQNCLCADCSRLPLHLEEPSCISGPTPVDMPPRVRAGAEVRTRDSSPHRLSAPRLRSPAVPRSAAPGCAASVGLETGWAALPYSATYRTVSC